MAKNGSPQMRNSDVSTFKVLPFYPSQECAALYQQIQANQFSIIISSKIWRLLEMYSDVYTYIHTYMHTYLLTHSLTY